MQNCTTNISKLNLDKYLLVVENVPLVAKTRSGNKAHRLFIFDKNIENDRFLF